jgi:hypothetical protein
LLRICGVILLLIGLFNGVMFWESAQYVSGPYGGYYFLAGFSIFLGFLSLVFLNVIAEIAEGLRAIRYELSQQR